MKTLSFLLLFLGICYANQTQAQTRGKNKGETSQAIQQSEKTPSNKGDVQGIISIVDSDGEVVFEDNDPDATCDSWQVYLGRLDAISASYIRNNFSCVEGSIRFPANQCLADWVKKQNMSRETFFDFAAEYAANPSLTQRKYCTLNQQAVEERTIERSKQ